MTQVHDSKLSKQGRFAPYRGAQSVEISLGARSYPIYIGASLMESAGEQLAWAFKSKRVFVISDDNVSALYQQQFSQAFAGYQLYWHSVPAGEGSKSFAQFERLCNALLSEKIERSDMIIAFGGGVVGDLAGFVAASVLRGVPFIQIPTSLLAQVDSSVGGKTGINAPSGKNLIGAFYQPRAVLIDSALLSSLPERELRAGYAEVIKYALINQSAFYTWLLENTHAILPEQRKAQNQAQSQEAHYPALHHILQVSCQAKADIVAADERETGQRALLNLGHTFAHALEAHAGYDGSLLHGEAVAMGLVLAHQLSAHLGLCSEQIATDLRAHFARFGIAHDISFLGNRRPSVTQMLALMAQDKKVSQGKIGFILSKGIGQAFQSNDVDLGSVRSVLLAAGYSA